MSLAKVDKDIVIDQEWMKAYIRTIIAICRMFDVTVDSIRTCRSRKKGHHFYIATVEKIDAAKVNMLQLLLGDDALRVDYNRARIQAGFNEFNKLFEQPSCRLRTIYKRRNALPRNKYLEEET